jgi:hypothetical protein
MPCSVSQSEIDYYNRVAREEWEKEGRWDLLATKEQLAGWLCDALRSGLYIPGPEAQRWFEETKK